jgi:hypothetical protein
VSPVQPTKFCLGGTWYEFMDNPVTDNRLFG